MELQSSLTFIKSEHQDFEYLTTPSTQCPSSSQPTHDKRGGSESCNAEQPIVFPAVSPDNTVRFFVIKWIHNDCNG